jgi:hypothetical protein
VSTPVVSGIGASEGASSITGGVTSCIVSSSITSSFFGPHEAKIDTVKPKANTIMHTDLNVFEIITKLVRLKYFHPIGQNVT